MEAFFVVDLELVRLKFSNMWDAFELCYAAPRVEVEGVERGDAIEFEVSLPLNLLNHVLVLAGVNYTYGFYLDLAKGVSLHLLAELSSSGLREAWWNLAASILASDLNTAEDLFDAIDEFAAFLHDGVKPCKLRLWTSEEAFRKLSEAYPEAGSWDSLLADLRNKLSRGTLGLLRRA